MDSFIINKWIYFSEKHIFFFREAYKIYFQRSIYFSEEHIFLIEAYILQNMHVIFEICSYIFKINLATFEQPYSTALSMVFKWQLRIETVVIKLNEIKFKVFKVLFSKFFRLLQEDTNKSRLI